MMVRRSQTEKIGSENHLHTFKVMPANAKLQTDVKYGASGHCGRTPPSSSILPKVSDFNSVLLYKIASANYVHTSPQKLAHPHLQLNFLNIAGCCTLGHRTSATHGAAGWVSQWRGLFAKMQGWDHEDPGPGGSCHAHQQASKQQDCLLLPVCESHSYRYRSAPLHQGGDLF